MRRLNRLVAAATVVVCVTGCAVAEEGFESISAAETVAAATPTAVPGISSSPVASPTPSADPAPGGLAVGGIAQIVTTDLVMRSLPEISEASAIDRLTVPIGFLAYIVDGPVTADGYDWYRVAPFPPTLSDVVEEHPTFGWLAAAGKDGEQWIAPWDGDCPQPNWDGVMLSPRLIALSCWGGADLTLEGNLRHCDQDPPTGEPAWLVTARCNLVGPDYGDLLAAGLPLSFSPDLQAAARDGASVRVTGHLDDPAADTCGEDPFPGTEPRHPELVMLGCRLKFVVTEMTEL